MIRPVADRAVAVAPTVISGEQAVDGLGHVVLGPGPQLEQRDPGGGVRREHGEQPVPTELAAEAAGCWRQVVEPLATGVDRELHGVHRAMMAA